MNSVGYENEVDVDKAIGEIKIRNSGLTLDIDLDELNSRQSDLLSIDRLKELNVLVLGVGGIGSNAVHLMASMGVGKMTIVDMDSVGVENVWPGFFNLSDAKAGNVQKTDSVMNDMLWRLGHKNIIPINGDLMDIMPKLADMEDRWDIVIASTDSMSSRRYAWDQLRDSCNWWIDSRMGGPGAEVYAFATDDADGITAYMETFTQPVEPLPCGQKATAPLTKGMLMAMIGQVIVDITTDVYPYFYQHYNLNNRVFIQAQAYRENGEKV